MVSSTKFRTGLIGDGVLKTKHPSTGYKFYQAVVEYRSKLILHPRHHRKKTDALAQANRVLHNLKALDARIEAAIRSINEGDKVDKAKDI